MSLLRTLGISLIVSTIPGSHAWAWSYPWCASGTGISETGAPSCGFSTLEQCRAVSIRCTQNPLHQGASTSRKPAR
jgi:hypothetical protein